MTLAKHVTKRVLLVQLERKAAVVIHTIHLCAIAEGRVMDVLNMPVISQMHVFSHLVVKMILPLAFRLQHSGPVRLWENCVTRVFLMTFAVLVVEDRTALCQEENQNQAPRPNLLSNQVENP